MKGVGSLFFFFFFLSPLEGARSTNDKKRPWKLFLRLATVVDSVQVYLVNTYRTEL